MKAAVRTKGSRFGFPVVETAYGPKSEQHHLKRTARERKHRVHGGCRGNSPRLGCAPLSSIGSRGRARFPPWARRRRLSPDQSGRLGRRRRLTHPRRRGRHPWRKSSATRQRCLQEAHTRRRRNPMPAPAARAQASGPETSSAPAGGTAPQDTALSEGAGAAATGARRSCGGVASACDGGVPRGHACCGVRYLTTHVDQVSKRQVLGPRRLERDQQDRCCADDRPKKAAKGWAAWSKSRRIKFRLR